MGPKNYGIYVTVGSFVGVFGILLLGGLNKVIIREGSKNIPSMHIFLEKTIGIRNLLSAIAIAICIISVFFTQYSLQTKIYIIIFSTQLAWTGWKGFFGTIYQATEKMQYTSIFGIANRALFVMLAILFLNYGYGVLTLLLISLFVNYLILLINFKFSRKFIKFNFFQKVQFNTYLLKPALLFSLISFIGFLASRVDLLMISFLGTSNNVGTYGVAYKSAYLGEMLKNIAATAFFPVFIKRFHKRKVKATLLIRYSLLFGAIIFILTIILSLFIVRIVISLFGSDYRNSGEILRVLVFYLAFIWMTLPFTISAQATHNEKYILIAGSIMAVLNVALNYILFLRYGLVGIAYSTLVVFSVGSLVMSSIIYRIMKIQGYLV